MRRATHLATRVSANLEAPNPERLARLSSYKQFEEGLLQRMRWARQYMLAEGGASAGQTTQFVVGAADEADREILTTTGQLYHELHLARAYFSAFQPVPGTPLEDHPPTPALREHRLYQSDFLLRQYGFEDSELVFDGAGNLPLELDPKLVWAQCHPEWFPVEVNHAEREVLLRIPGIGPRSASRILSVRRSQPIRDLETLRRLGAATQRAAPFVLLAGRQPPVQLSLWADGEASASSWTSLSSDSGEGARNEALRIASAP